MTDLEALIKADAVLPGEAVIARRVANLAGEEHDSLAVIALALALAAARNGSSALDVQTVGSWQVGTTDDDLHQLSDLVALPDADTWAQEISRSVLVTQGVLHLSGQLVLLDRYWRDEQLIADAIRRRAQIAPPALNPPDLAGFAQLDQAQKDAIASVFTHTTTVLTGGPGMGKTHTIARLITALKASDPELRIALAAPTGKAAARMSGALRDAEATTQEATTLHRLLGTTPANSSRFVHNRNNPLPQDVVIVDEASMISLHLMARLIESLRDNTRLLLVGDPDQLASVDAGSVLGDLISGFEASGNASVIRLIHDHRVQGAHVALAQALRHGDATGVLEILRSKSPDITFVETDDPSLDDLTGILDHARDLHQAAASGDIDAALAALNASRVLTGHRSGPMGHHRWNRLIENALAAYVPSITHAEMYVGRPLLITKNDYSLGLANGDAGVIVNRDGEPVAVIETSSGIVELSPWRLADIETMYAMTVHKAQGSQARDVTVLVPPANSRLLTRELLYTAITRSAQNLTVVGSAAALEAGVRTSAARVSGLSHQIAPTTPEDTQG